MKPTRIIAVPAGRSRPTIASADRKARDAGVGALVVADRRLVIALAILDQTRSAHLRDRVDRPALERMR